MKRSFEIILLLAIASFATSLHAALPGYLAAAFETKRWIAYSPTGPSPAPASEALIREDLQTLHAAGFEGIVTYGCDGLKKQIPKLAREAGISYVVLGVYNPKSRAELDNARDLAGVVDAYCVGNEGLLEKGASRYSLGELQAAVEELRAWSGRPVSTSEQIEDYYDDGLKGPLAELSDWLFPNVHPFWHGKARQPEAAEWTRDEYEKLKAAAQGKAIVFKEVGLPTGSLDQEATAPDAQAQADYYSALRAFRVPFVYFEAFDQVWKAHNPFEPFWGLFDKARKPKAIISQLAKPLQGVLITSIQDHGRLSVRIEPEGGFFNLSGTCQGLPEDRELLLFVNTGDPAASGWFLQLPPNGIQDIDEETWKAVGQIGNSRFLPRSGQRIHVRILAAAKAEAESLRHKRNDDEALRNTGIYSQNLPKCDPRWRADVKDIELEVP